MEVYAVTRPGEGKSTVTEMEGYTIITEPSVANGGSGRYPTAVRLAVAALINCQFANLKAYVSGQGVAIDSLRLEFAGKLLDDGTYERMTLRVSLPEEFPEEKKKNLQRVVDACTVKKIGKNLPEIKLEVAE